ARFPTQNAQGGDARETIRRQKIRALSPREWMQLGSDGFVGGAMRQGGDIAWIVAMVVVSMLIGTSARANESSLELRVELKVSDESVPTHVCVIAKGRESSAAVPLKDLIDRHLICAAESVGKECKRPNASDANPSDALFFSEPDGGTEAQLQGMVESTN